MEYASTLQPLMAAKGQTKNQTKTKLHACLLVYQLMCFALSCVKGTERIPPF